MFSCLLPNLQLMTISNLNSSSFPLSAALSPSDLTSPFFVTAAVEKKLYKQNLLNARHVHIHSIQHTGKYYIILYYLYYEIRYYMTLYDIIGHYMILYYITYTYVT